MNIDPVLLYNLLMTQVEPNYLVIQEDHKEWDITFTATLPVRCPRGPSNCSLAVPLYVLPVGEWLAV